MAYRIEYPSMSGADSNLSASSSTSAKPVTPVTTGNHEASEAVSDGRIVAVLIDSQVLEAEIWLAFDEDFKSDDGLAVFYGHEIPFLEKMSEAELRRRYEEKRALGGGWIRDRIESTKH